MELNISLEFGPLQSFPEIDTADRDTIVKRTFYEIDDVKLFSR